MGMASSLILVANPGSASRKYAVYEGNAVRASLHFEWTNGQVVCTLQREGVQHTVAVELDDVSQAVGQLTDILRVNDIVRAGEHIETIGLRVVAPGAYFLENHIIDDDCLVRLDSAKERAPIHVAATLAEVLLLRTQFKHATIVGVSDSAFHSTKPDYAWNYGIPLEDADHLDVKRFGYHGLSVASVVQTLKAAGTLPPKLIVCHLGSGASVTAVQNGKSIDNTMGYSPLEGLVMSTRSGAIDPTAVRVIKEARHMQDHEIENYLNYRSGLRGLGGSSDIRELLQREANSDNQARLALSTYVYSVQKGIAQMAVAMDGVDALVFTGTVGERSAPVRGRIAQRLHHLDLFLDEYANLHPIGQISMPLATISRPQAAKPILVVPTNEAAEIARQAAALQ